LNEGAEAILLEIGRAYVSAAPSEEEAEEDQCHLTQQLLMILNREVARMLRSGYLSEYEELQYYIQYSVSLQRYIIQANHLLTLVKTLSIRSAEWRDDYLGCEVLFVGQWVKVK